MSDVTTKSGLIRIERTMRLLVVQDDLEFRSRLSAWLPETRAIHTGTAHEAGNVLRDAAFIDSPLDGLIVDVRLPDATGYRVVQDFRYEFPGVPIAMLGDASDLCLSIWARARGIQVLRKPVQQVDLESWLATLGLLTGVEA